MKYLVLFIILVAIIVFSIIFYRANKKGAKWTYWLKTKIINAFAFLKNKIMEWLKIKKRK